MGGKTQGGGGGEWRGNNKIGKRKRGKKSGGRKKKSCTDRELNPGLPRGRREFYH